MIGAAAAGMAGAYGVADYCGGRASARMSPLVVLLAGRCVVVPALAVAAPLTGHLTLAAAGWGAAAGVPLFLGFAGLYAAFGTGAVAVAAPTVAMTSAGVPLVAAVALGGGLSRSAWWGAVAAGVAVLLLTVQHGSGGGSRWRAFGCAAGGGAGLGLYTVCVSRTAAASGVWPLLVAQVVVLVAAAASVRRWPWAGLDGPTRRVVFIAASAELVGDVLGLVVARVNLALVGPALAVQPATSVVLARHLDGEVVRRVQWAGLVAAATAMVLLTTAV